MASKMSKNLRPKGQSTITNVNPSGINPSSAISPRLGQISTDGQITASKTLRPKGKSMISNVHPSGIKPAVAPSTSQKSVRVTVPSTPLPEPISPASSFSKMTMSNNSSTNLVNPDWLPTVHLKPKVRPVSRRTKLARKLAEQEMLAKQHTSQTVNYLFRRTRFNMEEIRALIEIYRKIRGTGKMDRLRFRQSFHTSLGLTDDVMLDRVFAAFDGDGEGSVSESEWVIGLSVMIRGNLDDQTAYCYEVFDVNGDRSIGRDELATCLRGCLYPIPGQEEDFDLEEGNREIVELAMKKLDLDRDGVIKYGDFHQAVKQDPLLLQAVGACLPTDHAMVTFTSLFDVKTRNFSTHLSQPSDPAWTRDEKDKFNPLFRQKNKELRKTRLDGDLKLRSVFSRNSINSLKGTRFNRS